jgi:hypothetical protein
MQTDKPAIANDPWAGYGTTTSKGTPAPALPDGTPAVEGTELISIPSTGTSGDIEQKREDALMASVPGDQGEPTSARVSTREIRNTRPSTPPVPPIPLPFVFDDDDDDDDVGPREAMPAGLTLDKAITWQIRHGEHRAYYIAQAAKVHQREVAHRIGMLIADGRITSRMVRGMTQYEVIGEAAA